MESDIEKAKRKVHRSPSYPAFNLSDAIQKAELVYRMEKRTATTTEVIAAHLGYSQANGPGGRAVSALRQYGLIEESAGRYRISDLGYTLIHFDHASDEWKRASRDAERHTTLFRELLEKFENDVPSDATLRNELLGRGFNPGSISDVVSIFRETLSFTGELNARYNENQAGEGSKPMMATSVQDQVKKDVIVPTVPEAQRSNDWTWTLSMPRNVKAALRISGEPTKSDIVRLKKQIEFLEESFEEEEENPPQSR